MRGCTLPPQVTSLCFAGSNNLKGKKNTIHPAIVLGIVDRETKTPLPEIYHTCQILPVPRELWLPDGTPLHRVGAHKLLCCARRRDELGDSQHGVTSCVWW